jgi:ParB-like chromosome segregation protein Spo0J
MKKKLHEIEKHELFQELFPINEQIKDRIKQDMSKNGFDENQPVVLATWQGQKEAVCIDGYTRVQVADELGIDEIPTVTYSVETEKDAFDIALNRQANRRSLTNTEIFQCIETMITRYGDPPNGGLPYTVEEIAEKLGVSKRKVERTLRVVKDAPPETRKQIKAGNKSINQAETAIRASRTESTPSSERPKKRRGESRMVEIDPDQWEQLTSIVEKGNTGAEIEDLVYEALESYLRADDDEEEGETESEEDCDRAEYESMRTYDDEDEDEESDVEAA